MELEGVGPLRAERALVDRTVGVALDVDHLAVLGVDVGSATDGAIGADAVRNGRTAEAGVFFEGIRTERLGRALQRIATSIAAEDWQAEHMEPPLCLRVYQSWRRLSARELWCNGGKKAERFQGQ